MPTDTVYGVAAEAFDPVAVDRLLAAKGRGRDMPPPVLVGTVRAAIALIQELGEMGKDLIDEFWPGGLTLVFRSSPTLVWDIGETKGTVAVRMPLHAVALGLLKKTGPLAVSSANYSGAAARHHRRRGGRAARRERGGLPGRRVLPGRRAVHHRGPDRLGAEAAPARRHLAGPAARGRPAGGRCGVRARSRRSAKIRSCRMRRALRTPGDARGHPPRRRRRDTRGDGPPESAARHGLTARRGTSPERWRGYHRRRRGQPGPHTG